MLATSAINNGLDNFRESKYSEKNHFFFFACSKLINEWMNWWVMFLRDSQEKMDRAALWTSEMFNQVEKKRQERSGRVFMGKKILSIKVTMWSTQKMS